ncbi:MAG: 50S ribosomal protein L10 [Planctomycetaceae bacterium]|nr:50S ribosomal protein L10 [Planctomycetaceae bacterium]
MSKLVKELITDDVRNRLAGVEDLVLVSLAGMTANRAHRLRMELRGKNMHVLVIKNSLARKAAAGTPLAPAFEGLEGPAAIVWGGTDIVDIAKEVSRLAGDKQFEPFAARGGVMAGSRMTADEVKAVSKWPSREEQLSLLVGQILGPGAQLASQLQSVGGILAGQIKEIAQGAEEAEPAAS